MHFLNSTASVVGNRDTSFASNPLWLFDDFLCIRTIFWLTFSSRQVKWSWPVSIASVADIQMVH
jgi:hypothetical protein